MALDRNSRLKWALQQSKVSQEKLGEALGISSQAVSERLNKDTPVDSIEFINAVVKLTGFSSYWLIVGKGRERQGPEDINDGDVSEPTYEYLSGKVVRPITVTVDRTGKELITYVPVKAAAGYTRGFGDSKYIEKLPAFNLPNLPQGSSYRMFQVDGDSMLQLGGAGLHDGDVVIGQYVEDIFTLKDNRVYVVVSTEGLLVKRVINRLTTEEKILVLKSDNKNGQYPDIIIHPKEILEVWELKAFISRQLSFSTDLWSVINDLQVEQALIKAKVNELARGGTAKELPEQEEEKNKRVR